MVTASSPFSTPSASDIRIAELEREVSFLRTQLLTKDAELSSCLAELTSTITETVTKSLEEMFFSHLNSVSSSVEELERVLLRPSTSYADISCSSTATVANPKRLKTERPTKGSMMDVTPPQSKAQTILSDLTAPQRRNCFYGRNPNVLTSPGLSWLHCPVPWSELQIPRENPDEESQCLCQSAISRWYPMEIRECSALGGVYPTGIEIRIASNPTGM